MINDQLAVQNILRKKYLEIQTRNPSYSVRAFSMKLGLHASATNEIMKGERRVSRKLAERIADRLLLDPSERTSILKFFQPVEKKPAVRKSTSDEEKEVGADYLKLTGDQFELISNWIHFGILSLVKTKNFESSATSISERFGITEKQAADALERLERLGLLVRKEGKLKRKHSRVNTPDDVLNISIQKAHIEDMELAKNSIMNDPVDKRDFTSMTMAVSTRLLPKAKEMIRKVQDEISDLLESEPTDEVYRMSMHLFPLSKTSSKEKNK